MDDREITEGVVRVLGRIGLAGTGFLVAPDVVMTCTHVLRIAGASEGGAKVTFQWQTSRFDGIVDDVYRFDEDQGDVALVKLAEPAVEMTVFPRVSWRGLTPTVLQGFGYPEREGRHTTARVTGGEIQPDEAGIRFLQLDAKEVRKGFSGAPLFDLARGRIVAMLRAREEVSSFALTMERIAELFLRQHGGPCEAAAHALIESVSTSLLPRIAWPSRLVGRPTIPPADLEELASRLAATKPLSDSTLRAELLVRLPEAARKVGWHRDPLLAATAIVDAMASHQVDGLALIAAALQEIDRDTHTFEFDEAVTRVLQRPHSERTLRSKIDAIKASRIAPERLRAHLHELAPGLRLSGWSDALGHEDAWAVRFLSNVRPQNERTPLAELSDRIAKRIVPAETPEATAEGVLLVAIARRDEGLATTIWSIVGEHVEKLYTNDAMASLADVEGQVVVCWSKVIDEALRPPSQMVVEFLLSRDLLNEDVEHWRVRFNRRLHTLAGRWRVVVRSWERVFEHRRTWPEWRRKWETRGGSLHRIRPYTPGDGAESVFETLSQENVSAVVFEFVPTAIDGPDDAIEMCIDAGIPIALWLRDAEALPPEAILPEEHGTGFERLPEVVRLKRSAALQQDKEQGSGRSCVTLLWDRSDRIPPDATVARENVSRKV